MRMRTKMSRSSRWWHSLRECQREHERERACERACTAHLFAQSSSKIGTTGAFDHSIGWSFQEASNSEAVCTLAPSSFSTSPTTLFDPFHPHMCGHVLIQRMSANLKQAAYLGCIRGCRASANHATVAVIAAFVLLVRFRLLVRLVFRGCGWWRWWRLWQWWWR